MNKNKIVEHNRQRFVNPYNFIPLGKKCQRETPKINEEDCYTGYFDCSMRLLTHLFIPNTSSSVRLLERKEWEKGYEKEMIGYDFFSYDDFSEDQTYVDNPPQPPTDPVIPGSEIRGAVRSVFEAAFNGCMSSVDGRKDLSRRCGEIKMPGFLYWDKEKNSWYLKRCKKARLRVIQKDEPGGHRPDRKTVGRIEYDSWNEGQEIWVRTGKNNMVIDYRVNINSSKEAEMKGRHFIKCNLHKGEYINEKKCEAVFYMPVTEGKPMRVCMKDIELLEKVLSDYRDSKKNSKIENDGWYNQFRIMKDGTYNLVYYAHDNKWRFYMCPACIGRETFEKTVESLLKNNGGYQPCSGEALCPACQLFGMMEKSEKPGTYAYGSKVRFTDAVLIKSLEDSSILFEEPVVLPEPGLPRPSAVEFYTESPYNPVENPGGDKKQGYWTYDYKYEYIGKGKNKYNIKRIALNENLPRIRGRKFYWHSDVDMVKFIGNKVNPMCQRIRPLKPNVESDLQPTFQFRVYFEQLDKKQIEQLKWSLDFGCPECAHKIGRGKPLGFGSVQIIVDGLCIREIDEENGSWNIISIGEGGALSYEAFFRKSGLTSEKIPDALKKMSNWKTRPLHVSYPLGEDRTGQVEKENANASHQWFRLNKAEDNYIHNFTKVLPDAIEDAKEVLEQEQALYKLILKKR